MYLPSCLELNTLASSMIGATFVWSNWSKIFPVETIPTKINAKWNENKKTRNYIEICGTQPFSSHSVNPFQFVHCN